MSWYKAFRVFNVSPQRYVFQYVLPLIAVGLMISIMVPFLLADSNPVIRYMVMAGAPLFTGFVAYSYPLAAADKIKRDIDNSIHFFITHMGVLATANLGPTDIFVKLGKKTEYGELAKASEQIASLVRSWNMGLPQASRFVAERTPSTIFGDFLERFAYAVETGEDLSIFFVNEQTVVIGDYATVYQAQLYGIDSVKDMYMSTMMSVIFLAVFGLISPLLTGISPTVVALYVVGAFLIMELVFMFLLLSRVPYDRLWTELPIRVGIRKDLDAYLPFTILLGLMAALASYFVLGWPPGITMAVATTPLLILGYSVNEAEKAIFRRDDNYPAFIRSLGASTAARGGAPREVLKKLRRHNFGPLTKDVDSLYRRLNLRLDDAGAWDRFAAETGSNLIEKFTAMFTEGIKSGGDPAQIGRILSENVGKILAVRKHRVQTAGSFRGGMLGLTGGIAFTLYIGVGMLGILDALFKGSFKQDVEDAATDGGNAVSGDVANVLFANFTVDMPLLNVLMTAALVIHGIAVALMITSVAGGSKYRAAFDFPILLWITGATAVLTEIAFDRMF